VPLIPQRGQSLGQELGQGDHLLERSTAFRRRVSQQRQPFPKERRMLPVDGGIEVLRLLAHRIQTHAVHPLTSEAGPPNHPIPLEQSDRTSDRAATRQQRLTQFIDRLLLGIADQ
jgi:hypothetical protein